MIEFIFMMILGFFMGVIFDLDSVRLFSCRLDLLFSFIIIFGNNILLFRLDLFWFSLDCDFS